MQEIKTSSAEQPVVGIMDVEGKNLNPLTHQPYTDEYRVWSARWSKLPTYQKRDEILKTLDQKQLLFIVSGTGSGKTVLVPKLALHYLNYQGKIAISLPKRNVTRSAAVYAALTLDVTLGKEVGFVFRGSDKSMINANNRLVYMTDGTLIVKLLQDPYLTEFNIIIVDEAHERKVMIDLILLYLKQILLSGKRPDLKVIIMSATIDINKYQSYYNDVDSAVIKISGGAHHHIDVIYSPDDVKEDSYLSLGINLIDTLLDQKVEKDMLFFLTTSNEAIQTCHKIRPKHPKVFCIEAYSEMPEENQIYVESEDKFMELGDYQVKLVMATNVAESSLTIAGLKYVIDSCYELYAYFDPDTNANVLDRRLITQAQALQRRGRVGRTSPGICYHLISKPQFDHLRPYPEPEILRQDLTVDILQMIYIQPKQTFDQAIELINQLMDIPKQNYINYSYDLFMLYQLIDHEHKITTLGKLIILFKTIPLQRTLFIYYAYQTYCAKEACQIVALLELSGGKLQNLFMDKDNVQIKSLGSLIKKRSDHLTYLSILQKFQQVSDREVWARKHGGLKLKLLQRSLQLANSYYYRMVNAIQKQQLQPSEMERVNKTDVSKRLLDALKQSHQHCTAKKMQAIYAKKKVEADIQRYSAVLTGYPRKQLMNKEFIYDQLLCLNGKWEFNVITLI